jgi:Mn-dependent DtxR family transcriptional regulator
MVNKSITKDELYLVKLFELAQKLEDTYAEVDRYAVGKAMGQNNKSVDNIVRMLAQTNFIKKGEGDAIFLTPQGERYVATLKDKK